MSDHLQQVHWVNAEGPLEEIRKSGQGAPLAENLIANKGIMHPWCRTTTSSTDRLYNICYNVEEITMREINSYDITI